VTEELEPSKDQRRSKVWVHPDRETIEALMRRGKSAEWIALWLEEKYPLDDEEGGEHEDARNHKKWQLGAATLDRYRSQFMPEVSPGLDMVRSDVEDIIGRHLPAVVGPQFELGMLEASIRVAEHNLQRALAADDEMEMLQPTTLTAHSQFTDTVMKSFEAKSKIGMPGYEAAPDKMQIDQTNRNLSVELHGKIDPRTGQVVANEPEKVELMKKFIEMPPEQAQTVIHGAQVEAQKLQAEAAIEAEATEVTSDAEPEG
jgi:hypothetical protein